MIHCLFCGNDLECEYGTLDEYGRLEQYHCYDCDTLYTLRYETISYMKNATKTLTDIYKDLELNKKYFL